MATKITIAEIALAKATAKLNDLYDRLEAARVEMNETGRTGHFDAMQALFNKADEIHLLALRDWDIANKNAA